MDGIRNFGVAQAEAYLADLLRIFDLLANSPAIARLRTEFRPAMRIHPHRAHLIIYRDIDADVLIVRIRHGREDWLRDEG